MKPAKTNTTKNLTKGARLNWQPIGTATQVILTPQMIIGQKVTLKDTNTASLNYLLP